MTASAPSRRAPKPNHLHTRDCSHCAWRRAGDAAREALTASGQSMPERIAAFVEAGCRPHDEYVTAQVPEQIVVPGGNRVVVRWRRTGGLVR